MLKHHKVLKSVKLPFGFHSDLQTLFIVKIVQDNGSLWIKKKTCTIWFVMSIKYTYCNNQKSKKNCGSGDCKGESCIILNENACKTVNFQRKKNGKTICGRI